MKTAGLLFVLVGISFVSGECQKMLGIDEVLAGARQDATVQAQAGHIEYARQINPRLPLVDRISLRTQTDRLELERQRYAVRISLNSIRQIRAERNVQRANLFVAESRERSLLHEALAERYEVMMAHRQTEQEIDLYRQLKLVFDDKINVLKSRAAYAGDVDVEEMIEAEYDRDAAALNLAAAEQALLEYQNTIVRLTPGSEPGSVLNTSGFLSPEMILTLTASLSEQLPANPEFLEQTAKVARAEAQYQAEKARSRQIVDFVQVRHDNRPSEPFSRDISFAIGLNLPFRGSSMYKMEELKIEKNAAETALLQEQVESARRIQEVETRLATLDTQHRQAKQQLTDSQALFTLRQASAGVVADPMALLRAKELLLKRQQRLLEVEAGMYAQYLNLLDWSGAISAEPLVNYLSNKR